MSPLFDGWAIERVFPGVYSLCEGNYVLGEEKVRREQ